MNRFSTLQLARFGEFGLKPFLRLGSSLNVELASCFLPLAFVAFGRLVMTFALPFRSLGFDTVSSTCLLTSP